MTSRAPRFEAPPAVEAMLVGAIAGLTATSAMTLAMDALFRQLPPRERQRLPPRRITDRIIDRVLPRRAVGERTRRSAALASHYGYGAAVGALYAPFALARAAAPLSAGIGYGLAVWAASYLGWIPAMGILPPATRGSPRRVALMIAVHVVWGAATGFFTARLHRATRRILAARRGKVRQPW